MSCQGEWWEEEIMWQSRPLTVDERMRLGVGDEHRPGYDDELRAVNTVGIKARGRPGKHQRRYDSLYFIEYERGFMKIGRSCNVDKRLESLKQGGPLRCWLALEVVRMGDYEHLLHKRFAKLRHRGEWFEKSHELTQFISRLAATASNERLARVVIEGEVGEL